MAFSLPAHLSTVSPEFPTNLVPAAQTSPPALFPPKGSTIKNSYDSPADQEEEFSLFEEAFIDPAAQLESL